jgi:hypothetical protein
VGVLALVQQRAIGELAVLVSIAEEELAGADRLSRLAASQPRHERL